MTHREVGSGRRAQSCDRKSARPVAYGTRHRRSSSAGPTQSVYSTPLVRQSSAVPKSSSRGTSARKFLGNVQLPTGDREFQRYAVNRVRNFFSDRNIHWATIGSQPPSVATSVEMFNYLFKMLFKDINLDVKNYADEIPRLMKLLSYPLNIHKSSLVTINTKNTWPSVLAMFVFLVDHVSMIDKSTVSEMVCSASKDSQDFEMQSEVFWHTLKIYRIWNKYDEGEDEKEIDKANKELQRRLKQLYPVDEQELNDMAKVIQILETNLKRNNCINLEEEVQELQAKKNGLCRDEEMAQSDINKLLSKQNEMTRQIQEKKKYIFLLVESNNKKREEIQRLEELCNTQEMTVEVKDKIQQECMELRQRIKDAEQLCSSLKVASYQTDQEIARIKNEVDSPFVELKKFQCEKNVHIPEISGLLIGSRYNLEDWKCVKNELHNLKKQLISKKLQLGKCSVELQKEISMWKEQFDQLLEDEVNGKRSLQDLEELIEKLKSAKKKIDANVEKKEREREENLKVLNEINIQLQDITAELEACKKQYAKVVSEGRQKIEEEEAQLQWMKDNLQEIKNDFIEKTGWNDVKL